MTAPIRFDDGAAYERYMGVWSQLVGRAFLEWCRPQSGLRWLDVGCGNGAFTELLVQQLSPRGATGVDPSEAQLGYARARASLHAADIRVGDAMALPFDDNTFDAAIMPLVIFFVPEPATGAREMARVVCPGGLVAAYAWDMDGQGFPYLPVQRVMRELEIPVPTPPNAAASDRDVLHDLWTKAGLEEIAMTTITIQRTFASFEEYWDIVLGGPSVGGVLASLAPFKTEQLQQRLREQLPTDADGRITYRASANAVTGRRPALVTDRASPR
jgi:ubiquinone/menaquinone biosynthesis C-methylase UbiE